MVGRSGIQDQGSDLELCLAELFTYDGDGWLVSQYEVHTDDPSLGGQAVRVLSPFGFDCRPKDPDRDPNGSLTEAAPLLFRFQVGDTEHVIPLTDRRQIAGLEALAQGASRMYDFGGCFLVMDPVAKTVRMNLPDGYTWDMGGGNEMIDKIDARLSSVENHVRTHKHGYNDSKGAAAVATQSMTEATESTVSLATVASETIFGI